MMEQSQQQQHQRFDTCSDRYTEPSMVRCKTADLIGNLRRKGQKYFHSDSEDEDEEDERKSKDEETSSNSSEYDEVLICNVCDRSFRTLRQLIQHQSTKRHFECSVCHQLFPSLFDVKAHKESTAHWTQEDEKTVAGIPVESILVSMAEGRRGSRGGNGTVGGVKSSVPSSAAATETSSASNLSSFPCDERLL